MAARIPVTPSSDAPNPTTEGYTVLARRYRPQQFGQLVGQEAVVRSLINSLKSNRVAHAYLFTGARGVGKTTIARILAKALNCREGPTVTPCDQCDSCKGIASGEDVDVLEIDGASNRGIDEVRAIRDNVQYRPQRSRFKIYIIDEVHMLTPQAFNALLKTLEEPPPHVKFFFATTEVQRIPITILSRCQRFDLGGIGVPQIVERLREIVGVEHMQADDEALELVARRAAGSMRDAQSLLDQLLAFAEERLTVDQVHRLLGSAGEDRVIELADAILTHEPAKALELLGKAADQGLQLGELLDQLIAYWRDLMVVSCSRDERQILSVAARHRSALREQANRLTLDTILAGLDVLNSAKARLRMSNHGRLLVEMAVVRLGRLENLVALSQMAQWMRQAGATVSSPIVSATQPLLRVAAPETEKKKLTSDPEAASAGIELLLDASTLAAVWPEILTKFPPLFAGSLDKAGLPAISGPNALVLCFPARYTLEQEYCGEAGRVARIEDELAARLGRHCRLRVELATDGQTSPPETKVDPGTASRLRGRRKDTPLDSLSKRAMDVMAAQVLQRDEGFGVVAEPTDDQPVEMNGEE
jgi:DNA polymerase-3 subunit gamma/tau